MCRFCFKCPVSMSSTLVNKTGQLNLHFRVVVHASFTVRSWAVQTFFIFDIFPSMISLFWSDLSLSCHSRHTLRRLDTELLLYGSTVLEVYVWPHCSHHNSPGSSVRSCCNAPESPSHFLPSSFQNPIPGWKRFTVLVHLRKLWVGNIHAKCIVQCKQLLCWSHDVQRLTLNAGSTNLLVIEEWMSANRFPPAIRNALYGTFQSHIF